MAKKISPEAQAILSAADEGLIATTVSLIHAFVDSNPSSQRAWLDLGRALGELSRYDDAESAFQKAIDLAENEPCDVAFGEIGNLYRNKGEFETAKSWYQKQIDASPQDATGYLYLGNLLLRQGKWVEAEKAFQDALGCQFVCLEETHYSLGLVNRSMGLYSEAKSHFEKALESDPSFGAAKLGLKDIKRAISLENSQG